jgi:hypothetical protein
MRKSLSELIDELSIVNVKIFMLVERVERDDHTREDATAMQSLIKYRSRLKNAINELWEGGRQEVKVYGSDVKARKVKGT